MGCCTSRPSSSPYPSSPPTASTAAINQASTPRATIQTLPRLSTESATDTHSHRQRRRRPRHHDRPLTEHFNRPLGPSVWVPSSKDRRWTKGELEHERTVFWETRVTNRPEIWGALREVIDCLHGAGLMSTLRTSGMVAQGEDKDTAVATAQSILDAAEITLPTGDLTAGAYDTLGGFYSLPRWVVVDPPDIGDSPTSQSHGALGVDHDGKGPEVVSVSSEDEAVEKRKDKGKGVGRPEKMLKVRARLSEWRKGSGDVMVAVGEGVAVWELAREVEREASLPPNRKIRIAYMGKLLNEDAPLSEQGWKEGHVVNALVFGQVSL